MALSQAHDLRVGGHRVEKRDRGVVPPRENRYVITVVPHAPRARGLINNLTSVVGSADARQVPLVRPLLSAPRSSSVALAQFALINVRKTVVERPHVSSGDEDRLARCEQPVDL